MDPFARVLLIDTSSRTGRLALGEGERIVATCVLTEARRHARDLTLRTQEMLQSRGWLPSELTAVIVSVGPGSFTGLRVGVASAKGLVYATQCALFAVPAFDAIAIGVEPGDFDLMIVADALQGMIYAASYRWLSETGWARCDELAVVPAHEWIRGLKEGTRVAGPGLSVIKPLLNNDVIALESANEATSENLLDSALHQPTLYRTTAWEIAPIYLRGSSAEEKRNRALENSSG